MVRQLARREAEQLTAGKQWHDSGFIFTTELGRPLHGSKVASALHEACARAGVPRVRIHDLRHSCATFLMAQSVPLAVLMATP